MNDQKTRRMMRPGVMLCLCFSMAACGGGTDDDATDQAASTAGLAATSRTTAAPIPAPTPTPQPTPQPVPAPTPEAELVAAHAVIDASCGLNGAAGIAAEVLERVNALRAAGAVCGSTIHAATTPLNWNSMLLQAASGHSSDMAQNNYFSHTSLDGRTMAQRIGNAGYNLTAAGENIAAAQTTVQEVMTSWINSPGHCQNLMNPMYRDIGAACVRNDAANYGFYWTMNLGRN